MTKTNPSNRLAEIQERLEEGEIRVLLYYATRKATRLPERFNGSTFDALKHLCDDLLEARKQLATAEKLCQDLLPAAREVFESEKPEPFYMSREQEQTAKAALAELEGK